MSKILAVLPALAASVFAHAAAAHPAGHGEFGATGLMLHLAGRSDHALGLAAALVGVFGAGVFLLARRRRNG